jgi:hypothetical protein
VVHIIDWRQECSGAGGEHYTLQLDEPGNAPRVVHAGGHGRYLGLDRSGSLGPWQQPLLGASGPVGSGSFVAEVALRDPPYDGNYDAPGWCLSGMPAYAGRALRLLPASDRDDARRRLAEIAVLGMSPTTATIGTPTGKEQIAIARVIGPSSGSIPIAAIEGSVPRQLTLPDTAMATLSTMPGDVYVIASVKGAITRVLLADDLASARAWAAAIRTSGWPPAPLVLSDETTRRDQVPGKVVAGKHGCGAMFVSDPIFSVDGTNPGLSLSARAPARTRPGDALTVLATKRFAPDPCGATLRVVRAYRTPPTGSFADTHFPIGAKLVFE